MSFRDQEKARLVPLKTRLFSPDACDPGIYHGKRRDFCLWNDFSFENLHPSLRAAALDYFAARGIGWNDGLTDGEGRARAWPSNHLCCAQSFAVNAWFPFRRDPQRLAAALRDLGLPVAEVLPFEADRASTTDPSSDGPGYVAFAWGGAGNLLGEGSDGDAAGDDASARDLDRTRADFAFRYRRSDGAIEIVLGAWKYTDEYPRNHSLRHSESGTDRLRIYGEALARTEGAIRLDGNTPPEALFFDPFDQMMRLQLLADAMERAHEMDAARVSVLHVAPRANHDLIDRITSPALAARGGTIHDVWRTLAAPERFRGAFVESVLPVLRRHAPDAEWASYMETRYPI